MIASLRMFYTSVGRKLVMAMTGLFLCVFLLEHLYGNLQLYKMDGGTAFNEYGEFLVNNLLIRIVEYLLFGSIILHLIDGLYLTYRNRQARPVRYAVNNASKNSSWFSRNMGLTGSVILVFLVVHLRSFFVPHRLQGVESSMAYDVASAFQSPGYALLYVVSMVILAAHLNHGFQSAFHTLGWNNHKYSGMLRTGGSLFALLILLGFSSFPILFHFDLFGVASNILQASH